MLGVAAALLASSLSTVQLSPRDVRVGHWLEGRGSCSLQGMCVAEKAEILEPQDHTVLIGSVPVGSGGRHGFRLLGQSVRTSARTRWRGVEYAHLAGHRVKVEGAWAGRSVFEARKVSARGDGRDRVRGRVDSIRETPLGIEVRIMSLTVRLPEVVESRTSLGAPTPREVRVLERADEDELFGTGFLLTRDLLLSGQVTLDTSFIKDYDLDGSRRQDRSDWGGGARVRLQWSPGGRIAGLVELRRKQVIRDDRSHGSEARGHTSLGEAWLRAADLVPPGFDLYLGRQDFEDPREWVYDQNLDAVRLVASRGAYRLELSASTTLFDGSRRDEAAANWMAYLARSSDRGRLAAYAIHRSFALALSESTTHLGLSALGEWIPQSESWLEASLFRGRRGDVGRLGWAVDAGTTWKPDALGPLALTLGFAVGSGDRTPGGTDGTFRQTGLQDNNHRFAGVTSFRYYGEVLDPELANLRILTLGLGVRLARRTSLDVVYHRYRQDVPMRRLFDAQLDRKPDGIHAGLGWGLDVILGSRRWHDWDMEAVLGTFAPGPAFSGADLAWLLRLQTRYRF